jgi:hypothetical protein
VPSRRLHYGEWFRQSRWCNRHHYTNIPPETTARETDQ